MLIEHKPLITREAIFNELSEISIFSTYSNFKSKKLISSPFRKDVHPSFTIFKSNKYGIYLFKDLTTGESGDCIVFVQKLFNLSYYQTICKIANDFNLAKKYTIPYKENSNNKIQISLGDKLVNDDKLIIIPKRRKWIELDAIYWNTYNINRNILERYGVYPSSLIQFTYPNYTYYIKPQQHCYIYPEIKDNIFTCKIYQPFESKGNKWRNNIVTGAHFGYRQLPNTANELIITKSGKDVMSIVNTLEIPSIGIQGETFLIKDSVMEEYKNRFDKIYILLDNDESGINSTKKYIDKFNYLNPLITPDKDFTDTIKNKGIDFTKKYIKNQL